MNRWALLAHAALKSENDWTEEQLGLAFDLMGTPAMFRAGNEPGAQLAGGLGAFFLLTEPPERYGLPAEADSPIQENVVPATLAAVGAGFAAAAGVALAFRARPTPPDRIGALTLLGVGAGVLELAGEVVARTRHRRRQR